MSDFITLGVVEMKGPSEPESEQPRITIIGLVIGLLILICVASLYSKLQRQSQDHDSRPKPIKELGVTSSAEVDAFKSSYTRDILVPAINTMQEMQALLGQPDNQDKSDRLLELDKRFSNLYLEARARPAPPHMKSQHDQIVRELDQASRYLGDILSARKNKEAIQQVQQDLARSQRTLTKALKAYTPAKQNKDTPPQSSQR